MNHQHASLLKLSIKQVIWFGARATILKMCFAWSVGYPKSVSIPWIHSPRVFDSEINPNHQICKFLGTRPWPAHSKLLPKCKISLRRQLKTRPVVAFGSSQQLRIFISFRKRSLRRQLKTRPVDAFGSSQRLRISYLFEKDLCYASSRRGHLLHSAQASD